MKIGKKSFNYQKPILKRRLKQRQIEMHPMLVSNLELLRHILDEISFVLTASSNKEKEVVINDPVLSRAIIRSLEIIEEASAKLHCPSGLQLCP